MGVERASTVLVGTSRIQAAIDPLVWADATNGEPPIQLALVGSSPVPILENLAADPEFAGTIVYGVVPRFFFNAERAAEDVPASMVRVYQETRSSPARRVEIALANGVAGRLVIRNPELTAPRLIDALVKRSLPQRPRMRARADRFTPVEVSPVPGDQDYERFFRAVRPMSSLDVEAFAARLQAAVDHQQAKGGAVVFVALPACGEVFSLQEAYFPKSEYWDRFARSISAPVLWAYDYPELLDFECGDGSHLGAADVPAFTRALAARVAETLRSR